MKMIYGLAALLLLLQACKKDKTVPPVLTIPVMHYLQLNDEPLPFGQIRKIDIDGDGTYDFRFSTLLVGDPVLERDRRQFYASSGILSSLLSDPNNETPVMNKADPVYLQHDGYEWFEASSIVLAENIVPARGVSFWRGNWKNTSHKYPGVQVKKNGNIYNGWIELSFDTPLEQIILHQAAIAVEPGKTVHAGY
jgi:hypothetical protein